MRIHRPERHVLAAALLAALTVPLIVASPVSAQAPTPEGAATRADGPVTTDASLLARGLAEADAVAGGPRPTSLRLSADDSSTTVLVPGLGSASAAQAVENRSYRHSDLQPTGRYVRAGETVTVTVPEGAPSTSVSIGLTGPHTGHNGGAERARYSTPLTPGVNTVSAPLDGMVALVSQAAGGSADLVVAGGQPVPVFVVGETTNEHLRAEMTRLPSAPFVEIVGERFFGDFQAAATGPHIARADVEARVALLDEHIEITNDTYGLLDDAVGMARKAPHRIYIASPDSGAGYANATHERIMFQVNSGAAADLFRLAPSGLWGFWHEVGHTYQTPSFNWAGLGEVLVNLSPLHIQNREGWGSRLDSQVGGYDGIFRKPVDERHFQSEGTLWGKLFLFDHLRRGFGDDFYPRLNHELRVLKARGESQPTTDEAKRQLFAVTAARVADRDLREFFRQWGIPLDDATTAVMAELPPLQQPIWQNRLYADLIREYEMPPYSVPLGSVLPIDETVALGQRQLTTPPRVSGLVDSDGSGEVRVQGYTLQADTVGTGRGQANVTVVNDQSVREVLSTPVSVRQGSAFTFRGFGDRTIGTLALEPTTHEIRFLADTTYAAHSSFPNVEYIGATVYDTQGRETGSLSVLGRENAHAARAAFDGTRGEDGGFVVVRHREANSRLTWWNDDVQQPREGVTTRTYRIEGTHFVRVDSVPTPSPVVAAPVDEPVVLSRTSPTGVPIAIETTTAVASLTGQLVLTAPRGTVFTEDQEALEAQVRRPGGEWVALPSLVTGAAVPSDDGSTLTVTVSSTDDLGLVDGAQVQWAPQVTVDHDASAGSSALDWSLTGTADDRAVTARS